MYPGGSSNLHKNDPQPPLPTPRSMSFMLACRGVVQPSNGFRYWPSLPEAAGPLAGLPHPQPFQRRCHPQEHHEQPGWRFGWLGAPASLFTGCSSWRADSIALPPFFCSLPEEAVALLQHPAAAEAFNFHLHRRRSTLWPVRPRGRDSSLTFRPADVQCRARRRWRPEKRRRRRSVCFSALGRVQ